jgi:phosphatidylserine/phosphatidylglycerophosphate/cardiolipin synthase-like enzyme
MAARRAKQSPWCEGCAVEPLIGGYAVMSAIRDDLERMTAQATASARSPGERGFVYLADWRMNAQRDLSSSNGWGTDSWGAATSAASDQTVAGLLVRLLHAGVRVRILLWCPSGLEDFASGWHHIYDHARIASIVAAASDAAASEFASKGKPVIGGNLGVVTLDARLAASPASHHQKAVVIRGGPDMVDSNGAPIAVAYVGGVDLAFTRRDAPDQSTTASNAQFNSGDWQSGKGIPASDRLPGGEAEQLPWPTQKGAASLYTNLRPVSRFHEPIDSDLYAEVYGDGNATTSRQIWHDQHLRMRGTIVEVLEGQFVDRWMSAGTFLPLPARLHRWNLPGFGQAYLSSQTEIVDKQTLATLPDPAPVPPASGGNSIVQMWRTIPVRHVKNRPQKSSAYADHKELFGDGEFTVLGGLARAAVSADNLIWIFDQYFWSRPYAQLLAQLVGSKASLHVIVIVPVHSDIPPDSGITGWKFPASSAFHKTRWETLSTVQQASTSQVSVWNLWDRRPNRQQGDSSGGLGIYVHAKAHTYDGSLYVCGSANLNRRSLTGDSEICCAVLDQAVVTRHLHERWQLLFPGLDWPKDQHGQDLQLDTIASGVPGPSPGAQFHAAFRQAAASDSSFLIPYQGSEKEKAKLPNGTERDGSIGRDKAHSVADNLLESSSLPLSYEADVALSAGGSRPATLADVAAKIAARSTTAAAP